MKTLLLIFLATVAVGQTKPDAQRLAPRSSLLMGTVASGEKLQTFHITGMIHEAADNDCNNPPIVVRAKDRIDAFNKCQFRGQPCSSHGITVWSEAEWADSIGDSFAKSCPLTTKPDHYKERLKAGGVTREVMDVPAIKEDIERPDVTAYRCGMLGGAMCLPIQEGPPYRWTCTDKRRVLLTDESGGKHCILFPKERQ